MMKTFKKTEKQKEATKLIASCRYPMLLGGSRSGKTFEAVRCVIVRASKIKSRHLMLRYKFNHAKTSLWLDTLPKVLSICFPELNYKKNNSDYFIQLDNGSEIWIGGLDDPARAEKILGKEYSTMYYNECSQIPFSSVEIALTRLAEKNDLVKRAIFDMNPPTTRHWSYKVYVKGIHPVTSLPIDREKYKYILMNPSDNLENIDEDYITEVLDNLSPEQKARFKEGEFTTAGEGSAYYAFDQHVHVREISKEVRIGTLMIGMDFNVNPMTAVVGYYVNKIFYVIDEVWLPNSDTYKMCDELIKRGYRGAWVFPDSTGKNRKTSGISDHKIIGEKGFLVKPTVNPYVRDRVNNMNRVFSLDKVVIAPHNKKLIEDLEKVEWKGDDLDEGKEKALTHISDALGYWIWAMDNMVYQTPSAIKIS